MNLPTLKQFSVRDKTLLIRADLNVPLDEQGNITSDTRIQAELPTIKYCLERGAKVRLMSHLGRPKAGQFDARFSLAPIASYLGKLLQMQVPLHRNYLEEDAKLGDSPLCVLENVRFNLGETQNDQNLASRYARLAELFVMDAFATAHRAHASTTGIVQFTKQACAGPLLERELIALSKAIKNPETPVVAIVGGSKVSTKLKVLESLAILCDCLILGGGIANTFLLADNQPVGQSLCEPNLLDTAKKITAKTRVPLPTDVVVAAQINKEAKVSTKSVNQISATDRICDIGPETAARFSAIIRSAGTIIWNGPVGIFELEQFAQGTHAIAEAVAANTGFSLVGGGDTLAAVERFGMGDKVSYISTGGGAFLEYIEGRKLPAVAALEQHKKG